MPLARHAVLAVSVLQRAEARVGFDDAATERSEIACRRQPGGQRLRALAIDTEFASTQESMRPQRPQQHDVNLIQQLHTKPVADDAHAAVIRCRFLQPVAESRAERDSLCAAQPEGGRRQAAATPRELRLS